jgi:hypothetical protein
MRQRCAGPPFERASGDLAATCQLERLVSRAGDVGLQAAVVGRIRDPCGVHLEVKDVSMSRPRSWRSAFCRTSDAEQRMHGADAAMRGAGRCKASHAVCERPIGV